MRIWIGQSGVVSGLHFGSGGFLHIFNLESRLCRGPFLIAVDVKSCWCLVVRNLGYRSSRVLSAPNSGLRIIPSERHVSNCVDYQRHLLVGTNSTQAVFQLLLLHNRTHLLN